MQIIITFVRSCAAVTPVCVWTYTHIVSDPVNRLKLSMGPIQGSYSLYPRHVRASMLPKKETKYSYNAFQMA